MENASKALLIAGAILLAILLISLAIIVFNNARGVVNDSNMDTQKVEAFNSRFSQYAGTNKSASDVNSLVSAIQANNVANPRTRIFIGTNGLTQNTHFTRSATITHPSATTAGNYTFIFSNSFRYNVTYRIATEDHEAYTTTGYIWRVDISLAN